MSDDSNHCDVDRRRCSGGKLKIKIQEWHPIFCLMNSGAVDRRHQENRRVQEIIKNSWPLANEK